MARYAVVGQGTNTAAETLVNLFGSAAVRPKIYDLTLGSDATPADNAAEYTLQRTTAVGTEGTGFTPVPLDSLTSASVSDSGWNHSAEPTYTANLILLEWGQNQRATYRWVAAPGGELIAIAAANNGIGLLVVTVAGSAVNTNITIHFEE